MSSARAAGAASGLAALLGVVTYAALATSAQFFALRLSAAVITALWLLPHFFAMTSLRSRMAEKLAGAWGFGLLAFFWLGYLGLSSLSGRLEPVTSALFAAYLFSAPAVSALLPRAGRFGMWAPGIALALVWLPHETGLLKVLWPGPGFYYLQVLAAIAIVHVTFLGRFKWEPYDLSWRVRRADLLLGLRVVAVVAIAAIVVGLATGFLIPRAAPVWKDLPLVLLIGFLLSSLPEELLFRGIIQRYFERLGLGAYGALALATLIFALAHLNNPPVLDWRWVLLAGGAGAAYGWLYLRTRSIFLCGLTHAAVNAIDHLFFTHTLG